MARPANVGGLLRRCLDGVEIRRNPLIGDRAPEADTLGHIGKFQLVKLRLGKGFAALCYPHLQTRMHLPLTFQTKRTRPGVV